MMSMASTSSCMSFLHVALDYLGSHCGIQLLMHIYSILILHIISGISFSLNLFVPFMKECKLSTFFISSYTSWDLGTLKSWVPSDHLFSLIFQEAKHVYPLFSFLPSLCEFLSAPSLHPRPRTCHIEVSLFIFLNWQCCLNFTDTWSVVFLCTIVKTYPCTITLKIIPISEGDWIPILVLNFKSSTNPLLTELLGWRKPMTEFPLWDQPHF